METHTDTHTHTHTRITLPLSLTLSISLTLVQVQFNVVPSDAEAGFDIRIAPTVDLDKFEEQLKGWVESEPGVTYSFQQVHTDATFTPVMSHLSTSHTTLLSFQSHSNKLTHKRTHP